MLFLPTVVGTFYMYYVWAPGRDSHEFFFRGLSHLLFGEGRRLRVQGPSASEVLAMGWTGALLGLGFTGFGLRGLGDSA